MKKNLVQLCVLTALILISTSRPAFGGTFTWSGASGANLFWETPGNWTPAGPPGISDFAVFFDIGATNGFGATNISSEITNNITIQYLWLSQTNNFHNVQIDSGVTLTITGTNDNGFGPLGVNPSLTNPTNAYSTLYVGTRAPATAATMVSNSISGTGTLFLNNTNNELNIRQCQGSSGSHQAVLDMSGLNTFVANLGRIRVGDGELGTFIRAQGQLRLAATNTITLNGTNSANDVNLVVGNNSQNNNGNGSISYLFLGQTNRLNLNRILVGAQKQQGQILFNPLFASPSVVMRASDGVSRVSLIRVGDESDAGSTGNGTTGVLNLLPGTSDILADTVIVGKSQNGNNTSAATGNFSVGSGTLNVNTLTLAAQATSAFGGTVSGTATFSNTTVTVNSLLQMGVYDGANVPIVANLYINGGSMTVNGAYQNQGTVTMNITNATLTLPATAAITAKTIQLDGGTLANAAIIKATNTLTILDNGSIVGSPVFDLGNVPSPATWDVQAISGGSLMVNNALQGAGSISGNVILATGAAINPGDANSVGTLNINGTSGNLTLNNNSTLNLDLSASGSGANDQINASGTVTVNGTVNVFLKSVGGSLDTTTPYTLITAGTLNATASQFKVVGPLTTGRYTFTFDTTTVPNTVRLMVGGTGPANQTWVGDGVANNWDAQGAFNWNNGTAASQFFNLDNVSFTDTGSASPPVNTVGALVCGSLAVSNNVRNYTIGGAGSLTVAGSFNKAGTGSLSINNLSDNTLSSLTTISNGPVTFANNGQNTFADGINIGGGGSLSLSGNSTNMVVNPGAGTTVITIGTGTTMSVANSNPNTFNGSQIQLDGTLAFNQPVNAVFDSVLIDAGTLIQSGASTLTLAGNNSGFSGPVLINGGILSAGSTVSALGGGPITITNTGALDVNGKNIGGNTITVSGSGPAGAGALVSSGPPQNGALTSTASALQNIIMTADTTFGGSGSWNTDPVRNNGYWAVASSLSTGGSSYNLTKTGPNQVSLINVTVDDALGNINVLQGMLNFQGGTTSMGNPANNITVSAGATLSFYDTSVPWAKNFILFGDGVTPNIFNYDGTHIIAGPVTLNGNCVVSGAPAGRGIAATITMNGPITGSGALIKSVADNQGSIILAGTNTYTGTTTVAGGGVYIDGINGTNTVTVSSGATLGGTGAIFGPVTIASDGILSPGDLSTTMATLVISNSLNIAGTCIMDLNKSGAALTSDLVTNITALTLDGTLELNLNGDALAAGDSFQLFSFKSASGTIAGITPETPAVGLAWDTSHLTVDGTLRVLGVNPTPTNIVAVVSGGQLHLSWPADHTGWRLQVQTNALDTGLSTNWTDVAGSTIVNSMSFPIDTKSPAVFYQMTYP